MKNKSHHSKEALPLGNAFVTTPRKVIDWSYSQDLATCQKGWLFRFLWENCFYADSRITINGGHEVLCRRGEYIGTQREIAKKIKIMGASAVKNNLDKLKEEGFIEVERVNVKSRTRASRIRVLGYNDYNKPPSGSSAAKPKPHAATPVRQADPSQKESEEEEMTWYDQFLQKKKRDGRA